jgi:hypothetical protein
MLIIKKQLKVGDNMNIIEVLSLKYTKLFPIRVLVWYVSFGPYNEMTNKSLYTLRTKGKYSGDVIILGDQNGKDRIDISEDLKQKYNRALSMREFCFSKADIIHYVDFNNYDVCMYIDSDVVIQKEINTLLFNIYKSKNIIIQHNGRYNIDERGEHQGGLVLSNEQINKYGKVSLCAGIIAMPGGNYGKDFLSHWGEEHTNMGSLSNDQGNLCKMMIERDYISNTKYMPGAEWVCEKTNKHDNKESILIHCGGRRFKKVYDSIIQPLGEHE